MPKMRGPALRREAFRRSISPASREAAMKSRTGRKTALEAGRAMPLAAAIDYAEKSVVSRTLIDKKAGSLTLFAFDKDEGLTEHTSPYDAVVQVLEGNAELTIAGRPVPAKAGEMFVMPANVPHAVRAKSRFKMLLTMIWDKGA